MSARDTYDRLKPAMDAADARRAKWMLEHRLPGDTIGSATRRYLALRRTEGRGAFKQAVAAVLDGKAERARLAARLPGYLPLRDDGLSDAEWAALHPEREYRVRPHRPADGEPVTREIPCVTVIHIPTAARGSGIPVDRLVILGAVAYPRDTDVWAEMLFTDEWVRGGYAPEAVH